MCGFIEGWRGALEAFFPAAMWQGIVSGAERGRLEEIRVRAGRRVQLVFGEGEALTDITASDADCKLLLENLCEHSLYAREEELRSCFITLPGGHRVGLCGRAYMEQGGLKRLSYVTGFNLRIARACENSADSVMPLITENGWPLSTLLISRPGVGKTTMLRDIARRFSYGMGVPPRRVCIADERSEIAGAYRGVPMLDVGPRTDVLDGCPKDVAMRLLLRTMSPEVIITDEIGTEADAAAVLDASGGGVTVISSAHAADIADARRRSALRLLLEGGYLSRVLLLERERELVTVRPVA